MPGPSPRRSRAHCCGQAGSGDGRRPPSRLTALQLERSPSSTFRHLSCFLLFLTLSSHPVIGLLNYHMLSLITIHLHSSSGLRSPRQRMAPRNPPQGSPPSHAGWEPLAGHCPLHLRHPKTGDPCHVADEIPNVDQALLVIHKAASCAVSVFYTLLAASFNEIRRKDCGPQWLRALFQLYSLLEPGVHPSTSQSFIPYPPPALASPRLGALTSWA